MNETRTTQPFGLFFPLIFTVAKWICRLLHPVTVQGLENLPRHGALLVANHASNWDPLVPGHGAAHGLPAPCHGQGGTVPESHSGMGHPGGGRISREPGRCGHSSGENRHPDHSERSKSADLPGGHHHPERHRQGRWPAGPRPQRCGGDRRPHPAPFWCRCSWMEKSGPSTGHASSSASPIRRYIPAAGGLLRKCRRSRMSFCGRFTPWAGSR